MLKNNLPGALLKRYLIYGPFLLLCSTASAQTIYKWTDKTGKVHYGDSTSSPKDSAPLVTKAAENSSATPPAVSVEAPNLQKCLAMARQMADQKNRPTPSEIRSRSNELLALCPDTAYECLSYVDTPESNSCKAVPMQPGGHIVTNKTYNRSTPPPQATRQTTNLSEEEAAFQRRRIERENSEGYRRDNRSANCASARRALQQFDGKRVYRPGPGGERIYMDESERSAIENKARQNIADNC